MDRSQALTLLTEYVQNPALIKHALAVEQAMIHYARRFNQDETTWSITGLLHDFDYERFPNPPDHTRKGAEILRQKGVDEEVVGAILSHADWNLDEYPRDRPIRRTLFAVDELCGFIHAVALVRPQKIMDMKPSSVRKKMKQSSFAAAVKREDIAHGAEMLGLELNDHIANCIAAMTDAAADLELLPA